MKEKKVRGTSMKRFFLILLVAIIFSGGCGTQEQKEVVKEVQAEVQTPKPVFLMAGRVESDEKADIASKFTARVSKVMVDIGIKVKKGDPLLVLDTKDLEAQAKQAEAGVNIAQANLIKVKSGARSEQKEQAQAALDSANANYENNKKNYDRIKQLSETGAISDQLLEAAQGQLAAAEAQYKSAKEQLSMLNKGETQETINILEAQLSQAQAAFNLAQTQLKNGVISSPVSGVVSDKNINVGEVASSGTVLVSVVNTNTLVVNAYLPGSLTDKIKVGQAVVVKVSEIPQDLFQGEVIAMDPVIDAKSKNTLVKVALKEQNSALKPGMFAQVGIKI